MKLNNKIIRVSDTPNNPLELINQGIINHQINRTVRKQFTSIELKNYSTLPFCNLGLV